MEAPYWLYLRAGRQTGIFRKAMLGTEDLKTIASNLDYYGLIYTHTIRTVPFTPGLENTREHTEEFTPEIRRPKVVRKSAGYHIQMNKEDGKTAVLIYPYETVRLDGNSR